MPFGACTKTVMSFLQVDDNFLDLSLVKGHLVTIYSFFSARFYSCKGRKCSDPTFRHRVRFDLYITNPTQQSFREERKLELETLFCQIKIEVEWNWRRKLLVISTQKYILKRLNQFSGKPLNCFSKTVDKSETGMSVMSLHINWTNNIAVLA